MADSPEPEEAALVQSGDIAIGVDLVWVPRIERMLEESDWLASIFTSREIEYCVAQPRPAPSLAGRFAAKEATLKAIGDLSGFFADWREIEVVSDGARPALRLHGRIGRAARRKRLRELALSISHSGEYAIAQVVASRGRRAKREPRLVRTCSRCQAELSEDQSPVADAVSRRDDR